MYHLLRIAIGELPRLQVHMEPFFCLPGYIRILSLLSLKQIGELGPCVGQN